MSPAVPSPFTAFVNIPFRFFIRNSMVHLGIEKQSSRGVAGTQRTAINNKIQDTVKFPWIFESTLYRRGAPHDRLEFTDDYFVRIYRRDSRLTHRFIGTIEEVET
jgi:hypothetical protein